MEVLELGEYDIGIIEKVLKNLTVYDGKFWIE